MTRRWILLVTAVLLAAALAGFAQDDATSTSTDTDLGDDIALLFVQTAASGEMIPAASGEPNEFILVLYNVASQTTFFSDRPNRVAGSLMTDLFAATFPFPEDDLPNAALALTDPEDDGTDVVVITIGAPRFNPDTMTLIYDATVIQGDSPDGLSFLNYRRDTALAASFGECSLFIDSFWGWIKHAAETVAHGIAKAGEAIAKGAASAGSKLGEALGGSNSDNPPGPDDGASIGEGMAEGETEEEGE